MTALSPPWSDLARWTTARLRPLDYWSRERALAWGMGIGVAVGVGSALLPLGYFVSFFTLSLGLAAWLAYSGEGVVLLPREPEAEGVPEGFVLIPAGSFLMGSSPEEEGFDRERPVHQVGISAFLCQIHPVTARFHADVMGLPEPEGAEAGERPVVDVSWFDAIRFCNAWSLREGLTPCYQEKGQDDWSWESTANGYRLPTEAEWEYACRAGTRTRWSCGDDEEALKDYAWFGDNSDGYLHPVGQKLPNSWGLHDMHGNVWEWCWDWFGPYGPEAVTDPRGAKTGESRCLRGGSFANESRDLRSAVRFRVEPGIRGRLLGFRCVRAPSRQHGFFDLFRFYRSPGGVLGNLLKNRW